MPDDIVIEEAPFEDDVEIVEGDVSQGPSQEELMKQFEAQKAELAATKERLGIQTQLDTLASHLGKVADRPINITPQPQVAPRMSQDELRAKVDKELLDKPYEAITSVMDSYIGGAFQGMIANQAKLAKKIALTDPQNATIYGKYKDEVEAAIAAIPVTEQFQDPDFVNKAINLVKANHLNEMVSEMVAAELAKQTNAPKPAPVGAFDTAAVGGSGAPAPRGKKTITLKPRQANNIRQYMSRNMIPEEKFSDFVQWAIEDGTLSQYDY